MTIVRTGKVSGLGGYVKDGVLYLYDGGKDAFLVESESDLDDLAEAVPNPGIMAFTDGFADIWTLGADMTWTSAK